MSGHTPGIWSWEGNALYSDNGRIVLYVYANATCGRAGDDYYSCKPPSPTIVVKASDADKALLAAAPELLAALKNLLAVANFHITDDVVAVVQQARTAIARAKGG
jgi:hypothetical protein